jgi:hypothetical protein
VDDKVKGNLAGAEWAVTFLETIRRLKEKRIKDSEAEERRLRYLMFPKKLVPVGITAQAGNTILKKKKRKRDEIHEAVNVTLDETIPKQETLSIKSHQQTIVSRVPSQPVIETHQPQPRTPNALPPLGLPNPIPAPLESTPSPITPRPIFPGHPNSLSSLPLESSPSIPTSTNPHRPPKRSGSPLWREDVANRPSGNQPTSMPIQFRNVPESVQKHLEVQKIQDQGTVQITPCLRCFKMRLQCVKLETVQNCSHCQFAGCCCEGAVALGKWVEVNRVLVYYPVVGNTHPSFLFFFFALRSSFSLPFFRCLLFFVDGRFGRV